MSQRLLSISLLSIGILASTSSRGADLVDPAAARAQLQQGYALKQQGKCVEAIPHFSESVRLDRQPKALLNLADCEAKVGKLVAAQAHTVEARDLARTRGTADYEQFALGQLKDLEARLPRVVIVVTKDAPSGTIVLRDGVELGTISIGTPLPIDPGSHTAVARGGGLERTFSFVLAEREAKTIEVTPIGGTPTTATPEARPQVEPTTPVAGATEVRASSFWSSQRYAALGLVGAGLVGFGVSYAIASSAKTSWQDAASHCPANMCMDATYTQQADSARERANVATLLFAVGAGSLVTGGVLWFTAPRDEKVVVQVTPRATPSFGGVELRGRF